MSLTVLALFLVGCTGQAFRVKGEIASEGGTLETWRWRPQGCIRAAPSLGQPTQAVASLLWIDPVRRDGSRAQGHQTTVEDAPIRLDLQRVGGDPIAILETVRTEGTEFNTKTCRKLTLETQEEPPPHGTRNALAGSLHMDCNIRGQHVTADIDFKGCQF